MTTTSPPPSLAPSALGSKPTSSTTASNPPPRSPSESARAAPIHLPRGSGRPTFGGSSLASALAPRQGGKSRNLRGLLLGRGRPGGRSSRASSAQFPPSGWRDAGQHRRRLP